MKVEYSCGADYHTSLLTQVPKDAKVFKTVESGSKLDLSYFTSARVLTLSHSISHLVIDLTAFDQKVQVSRFLGYKRDSVSLLECKGSANRPIAGLSDFSGLRTAILHQEVGNEFFEQILALKSVRTIWVGCLKLEFESGKLLRAAVSTKYSHNVFLPNKLLEEESLTMMLEDLNVVQKLLENEEIALILYEKQRTLKKCFNYEALMLVKDAKLEIVERLHKEEILQLGKKYEAKFQELEEQTRKQLNAVFEERTKEKGAQQELMKLIQ